MPTDNESAVADRALWSGTDWERRQEVEDLLDRFQDFGLSLNVLIKETPSNWKNREACKELACRLTASPEHLDFFQNNRTLPDMHLVDLIEPGLLEKHRRYVTALVLILDCKSVKDYARPWKRRYSGGSD
ncbi:MAG: hypothetical protein ACM3MK_00155 [Chitinophagales bacterium]